MSTEKRDGGVAAEVRAGALQVLDYILKLELTPARWDRLAGIIEVAIAAEAAADLDGLRQATAELELTGPVRVIRIGGTPVVPPPPPVRERLEVLHVALLAGSNDTDSDQDEQ